MKGLRRTEAHHENPFLMHTAPKDARAPLWRAQRPSLMRSLLEGNRNYSRSCTSWVLPQVERSPPCSALGERALSFPDKFV